MNPTAPTGESIPQRNLYLGGEGSPLRVSRREGALMVETPEGPPRWFPLSRVACIHIAGGAVTLESDAMLACLERGIAVVFQGGGHELGMTVPMGRPGHRLGDNLEFLRSRPDAQRLLVDWLATSERHTILATCRALGHLPPDMRPQRVREWLRRQLSAPPMRTRAEHARRAFVRWTAVEIATLWSQEGLDPRLLAPWRHGELGVGAALTRLIAWDFELVLRRSVDSWPWADHLESGREHWHMLQVFENQRPHWHRLTQGWLDALDWWLEGVLA